MKNLLKKHGINVKNDQKFFKNIFSGKSFDADGEIISAKVIEKLLTIPELLSRITHRGVEIRNAIINDELELTYLKVEFPILFIDTTFNEVINLSLSKIESLVITSECKVNKGIRLIGAQIDGQLNFNGSFFWNNDGDAINAQNAIIKGHVFLSEQFSAKGIVDLSDINIRGDLICSGASFENKKRDKDKEPVALMFNSSKITGSVNMDNGFEANGEVRFIGAQIEGSLYCDGGKFSNPSGRAINAKMMKVGRDVYFDKKEKSKESFCAEGEVKLSGVQIAGQLRCWHAKFKEPEKAEDSGKSKVENYDTPKAALLAKGLKVEGPLFLNDIEAIGTIDLTDAKINGRFELKNEKRNENNYSLILKSAYAREFEDNKNAWTNKVKLDINYFTYNTILLEKELKVKTNLKNRICKIFFPKLKDKCNIRNNLENRILTGFFPKDKDFLPQPYLQMAKILDNLGHEKDANYLRRKMFDNKCKSKISTGQYIWLRMLKHLIGYGYKPFKVLVWALIIWILGVFLFCKGQELMKPPSKFAWEDSSYQNLYEHYPKFSPWIYTLDVFLPIVNFGQQEHWRPDSDISTKLWKFNLSGDFLLYVVYFEIIFGWFLTSMLIIGISGLVKQE